MRSRLSTIVEHLTDKGTAGYSAEWFKCLEAGDQSDNTIINAALLALTPKPSVALASCELGFILRSQASHYALALERNTVGIELYWSGYEAFAILTEGFQYMPTITIPINLDSHWGMCFVVPEPECGRARIHLGDSLGWKSLTGVLDLLRAFLALLYRKAKFRIEEKNHMSSVLGFENQLDGHSCGFYVVSACSTFTLRPASGAKLPMYSIYSKNVTEGYRQFCFDAFIDFIMRCNVIYSRILSGVVDVINQERRRSVLLTNGGIEMYSQHRQWGHLLRGGELFSAHSTVQELEPVVPQSTQQGMYSTATEGILSRPMVACKVIQSCNGCDLGIVDIIEKSTLAWISITDEFSNTAPAFKYCTITLRPIATSRNKNLQQQSTVCQSGIGGKGIQFFSHMEKLLLAGHCLGQPYVKTYVNSDWLLRVRLRCRLYKAPKNCAGRRSLPEVPGSPNCSMTKAR